MDGAATGYLSLAGDSIDPSAEVLNVLQVVRKTDRELSVTVTDPRGKGLPVKVYFTGLLPANSPLLGAANSFAADPAVGTYSLGRGGAKQTGPGVSADPTASETLDGTNTFAVYTGMNSDPLANSAGVICAAVDFSPVFSAKGQVLQRAIATGGAVQGVVQCPPVQTAATLNLYKATPSGPLSSRSVTAQITPQPEDRGQQLNVYSWAVAPGGAQVMQTKNGWKLMAQPMEPAATITVPDSGTISHELARNLDVSGLVGTMVYIGLGRDWEEVTRLNKAGHYYTVQ